MPSPRFNKDKVDFEKINIPVFYDHPVPVDLAIQYVQNNLIVSGSPSYNNLEYQPI
jgi:hypothetical protein